MKTKLPPQNLEAEVRVLASCIIGGEQHVVAQVIPFLRPEHFYRADHQLIFQVLLDIYSDDQACDLVIIRDRLKAKGKLTEVGGVAYLMTIVESEYSEINLNYYAEQVLQCYILRSLLHAADGIKQDVNALEADPATVIETAEKKILEATRDMIRADDEDTQTIVNRVMADIASREQGHMRGIPSGYQKIDEKTRGLKPGELVVIGARASVGKTAIALNICEHVAIDNNIAAGVFSLEMTSDSLMERILSSQAGVSSHKIQGGFLSKEEVSALETAARKISGSPIYIDQSRNLTPLLVRTKTRRLVSQRGVKMIILDYLQLLNLPGKSRDRYLEIGEMTRSLKALALELCIPVVVLSQLNRTSESFDRPRLSHLRESGNIEQDADIVLLIHRKDNDKQDEDENTAELIIAKNRNGPTGIVKLVWRPEFMRFENCYYEHSS